ncbi:hypothetical protein Q3G72_025859 [Acer saccharum]|nr:hypothetical protein Q3G72_025859 [Acer saccharum]
MHALLALFVSVIVSYGLLHKYLKEENQTDHLFKHNFVQYSYGVVTTSVRDGFITLTIKLLHFFVAKSLQSRVLSALQSASSIPSWLFWVAFTRSVSSMSHDSCNAVGSTLSVRASS